MEASLLNLVLGLPHLVVLQLDDLEPDQVEQPAVARDHRHLVVRAGLLSSGGGYFFY